LLRSFRFSGSWSSRIGVRWSALPLPTLSGEQNGAETNGYLGNVG
jgi:hypothetical protein